jgi:integrase
MREVWRPALKATKLDLSPHDLRHFFCSMLIAFGEDAAYVSQQARHKAGPGFTYKQYIHQFQEHRWLDREKVLAQFANDISPGRAYPVLTGAGDTVHETDGAEAGKP